MAIAKHENNLYNLFMKVKKLSPFFIIFIIALIMVMDLFFHPGRPVTFDGHVHITTMAQYYDALRDHEFPVKWSNNFANYGLPLPLIAHQVPSYLGALINFFVNNIVISYKLSWFIAIFSSSLTAYIYFKFKVKKTSLAMFGTFIYNFAPYRIINLYIRGALPEVLAATFIPLILLGLDNYLLNNKKSGLNLLIISLVLLAYTHPMVLLIFSPFIIAYIVFLVIQNKELVTVKKITMLMSSFVISFLISAYYLIPLRLEAKYLVMGFNQVLISQDQYLTQRELVNPNWYYFLAGDHPGPRGNLIKAGFIEISLFLIICIYYLFILKRKYKQRKVLLFWIIASIITLFMTTASASFLYNNLTILANIQFPYRFLSLFTLFLPLCLLITLNNHKIVSQNIIFSIVATIIVLSRFPQLYGKNYVVYDLSHYHFTPVNLHSSSINTVWMGESRKYPIKEQQLEIVEGDGQIDIVKLKNSSREYKLEAQSEVRVVDYTFYFPGWQVLANGKIQTIEFQDPKYRGIITYRLPKGNYHIVTVYQVTKIRKLAAIITILGIFMFIGFNSLVLKKISV